jgi:hypothetical protein
MCDFHNLIHHYHQNIAGNHHNDISKKNTNSIIADLYVYVDIITIGKHGPELHRNVPGIHRH